MDLPTFSKIVRYFLSQPPAAAGKRLRSERELSKTFDIGEAQVRKVFTELTEEGVLLRKRGSGTFVRRIADFSETIPKEIQENISSVKSKIFSDGSLNFSNSKGAKTHSPQLRIGLWCDIHQNSAVDQFIIGEISRYVSEAGHHFSLHNTVKNYNTGKRLSKDELRKQIYNHPCDGYLVVDTSSEAFIESIGNSKTPAVFFLGGTVEIDHEPIVMLDTIAALKRAMSIFYKQGYTKIGLIAAEREPEDPYSHTAELVEYESCMKKFGLQYRASQMPRVSFVEAMEAVRTLLKRPEPPQAIYVSDDNLLTGVNEALAIDGIVPGKDIAIITLGNNNFPLPADYEWSRMEFDRERFTEIIVENLLYQLQYDNKRPNSVAINASWIPGKTHEMKKGSRKISSIKSVSYPPAKSKKNPEITV